MKTGNDRYITFASTCFRSGFRRLGTFFIIAIVASYTLLAPFGQTADAAGITLDFAVIGAQYNGGDWLITANLYWSSYGLTLRSFDPACASGGGNASPSPQPTQGSGSETPGGGSTPGGSESGSCNVSASAQGVATPNPGNPSATHNWNFYSVDMIQPPGSSISFQFSTNASCSSGFTSDIATLPDSHSICVKALFSATSATAFADPNTPPSVRTMTIDYDGNGTIGGGTGATPCTGTTPGPGGYVPATPTGGTTIDTGAPLTNFFGSSPLKLSNNDAASGYDDQNEQRVMYQIPTTLPSNFSGAQLSIPLKLTNGFTIDGTATVFVRLRELTAGYTPSSATWGNQPAKLNPGTIVSVPANALSPSIPYVINFDITSYIYWANQGQTKHGVALDVIARTGSGLGTPVRLDIATTNSTILLETSATDWPNPTPTPSPNPSPTPTPTSTPSPLPTSSPTAAPTSTPTSLPTSSPSSAPTGFPTSTPTGSPSSAPSPITTGSPGGPATPGGFF